MSNPDRTSSGRYLVYAGVIGAIAGIGSVVMVPAPDSLLGQHFGRLRPPQAGDRWGGCNDARAAGTVPIYRGEHGYRDDMDGDGDGIACELPRDRHGAGIG